MRLLLIIIWVVMAVAIMANLRGVSSQVVLEEQRAEAEAYDAARVRGEVE